LDAGDGVIDRAYGGVSQIYANGDVNAEPKKVTLSKAINNWEKFLVECTKQLKLSTGPCKK